MLVKMECTDINHGKLSHSDGCRIFSAHAASNFFEGLVRSSLKTRIERFQLPATYQAMTEVDCSY